MRRSGAGWLSTRVRGVELISVMPATVRALPTRARSSPGRPEPTRPGSVRLELLVRQPGLHQHRPGVAGDDVGTPPVPAADLLPPLHQQPGPDAWLLWWVTHPAVSAVTVGGPALSVPPRLGRRP